MKTGRIKNEIENDINNQKSNQDNSYRYNFYNNINSEGITKL